MMRAKRVREGRSRSPPPRMEFYHRDFSPRNHRYSIKAQDWQYSSQIRDCQYSPQTGEHEYPQRLRDREYSSHCHENQEPSLQLLSDLGQGLADAEVERLKPGAEGWEYDRLLDRERKGQFHKPSQFNEAFLQEELPSLRFQWKHLLAEPGHLNYEPRSTVKPINDYGIEGSRLETERSYHGSALSNLGQHGILPKESSMPVKHVRETSISTLHANVDWPISSANLSSAFPLPSDNFTRHHCNDLDIDFQGSNVLAGKSPKRDIYMEEGKPLSNTHDSSQYMTRIPHSKTFSMASQGLVEEDVRGSYIDNFTLPSSGFTRSGRTPIDLAVYDDGHAQTKFYKSSLNPEMPPIDVINYCHTDPSTDVKVENYNHPEPRRSEKSNRCMQPDKYYENMESGQEGYASLDSSRTGTVDPSADRTIFNENSQWEHLGEGDQYHSFERRQGPADFGTSRISYADKRADIGGSSISYANERDQDVFVSGSCYPVFEADVYDENLHHEMDYAYDRDICHENLHHERGYAYDRDACHGNFHHEKDYAFRSDVDSWTYEENLKGSTSLDCDSGPYRIDGNSELVVKTGKFHRPVERMFRSRALMDKKPINRKVGNKFSSNGKFHGTISAMSGRNEQRTSSDVGGFLSKKSAFSRLNYKKTARAFDEFTGHKITDSENSFSSPNMFDYKQKHITRGQNPSSRYVNMERKHSPLGGQARRLSVGKPKPNTFHKKSGDRCVEKSHVRIDTSPLAMESLTKTEPLEGSEEFRQLVHNAFLKFVKQLNENPAQLKKYTEQGSAGNLKCIICGSDSESFKDTQCLAMHAIVSTTMGLKVQHRGFHKALCLVMGWKSAAGPECSWACEALSNADAQALKEDLIIWPPVVIVHNSSMTIDGNDSTSRMIVNSETLSAHLKDKGFGGGNVKVCHGKPGDHSIMVVTFSGTFSGLQEAERLHQFYAEAKHGRGEFQSLSGGDDGSEGKMENVLYGYLGLAGDLDKVDCDAKRCVVKSKRDIQAIADAPLKLD